MKVDKQKPHWSFWGVATIFLLWNLGGSINFLQQVTSSTSANFPDYAQAIMNARTLTITVAFGIAVFVGLFGSLLLFMRNKVALQLFIISGIGTAISVIHSIVVVSSLQTDVLRLIFIVLLPLTVALFLIGYSKFCIRKNWL